MEAIPYKILENPQNVHFLEDLRLVLSYRLFNISYTFYVFVFCLGYVVYKFTCDISCSGISCSYIHRDASCQSGKYGIPEALKTNGETLIGSCGFSFMRRAVWRWAASIKSNII